MEILPAFVPDVVDKMELSSAEEAEAESEDQKEELDWKIQWGNHSLEADDSLLASGGLGARVDMSLLYREITTPPPQRQIS